MRRGFTIYEVLIALALSTILAGVLWNVLLNSQYTAKKNEETLQYLRDTNILMQYLKTDIRNATADAAAIAGSNPEMMRAEPGDKVSTVKYTFQAEAGTVTRTVLGRNGSSKTYGLTAAGVGYIAEFMVTEVEVPGREPFYQIVLGFLDPRTRLLEAQGARDPSKRPKHHRIQALVSRRSESGADSKWKRGFVN